MIVKNENVPTSKVIDSNESKYLHLSVTPYSWTESAVDYVVSGHNGDEFGRFETIEQARKIFNS